MKMKMGVAIATRIASTGLQGALGNVHAVGTCLLNPSNELNFATYTRSLTLQPTVTDHSTL